MIYYGDTRTNWIERLLNWWLGRKHDADLRWDLGPVSSTSTGERTGKRA